MSETQTIAQAYRHCESLTREQAANFYYAIRLLPLARRRAICAVYAFARRVDDIAVRCRSVERRQIVRHGPPGHGQAVPVEEAGGQQLGQDHRHPADPAFGQRRHSRRRVATSR